ncbi:sugar-transfer associated ATP-grasp domain-containing protein [Winogradskyella helgolandensis]|uniref:sugar-transfer associated ATP-grasp domain-containing protein n=1 Tax=Winogradskyella helgolandensis TaxID=2697010 RepID=UPI0015CA29AB|nr:sugar-transfer associated ATP-grasp domain-containing protein [Winogradskyella helgolandensis]
MKELAKSIIEKSKSFVYHIEQNDTALKILKVVENQNGKLSAKNRKLCKEYALDVFGHKRYAPWLMTYCSYTNEFKEGWIPDNYYGEYVVSNYKGDYGKICDRSAVINQVLKDKHSSDIGYFINGLFLDKNNKVLNTKEFKEYLFKDKEKVVYKIENSNQGKGIYFLDKSSFKLNDVKKLGNGVFQKFIVQHPFFNQFNDSAVATIRLTSVCKDNGEIEVRAGYFRFGRTGDTHVVSSRQMRIPINIENGCLWQTNLAFYPDPECKFTKQLPDNDINYSGMKLPFFDKCISEIKRMHGYIPYIRSIGWDLIIDENDNLKIIELNGGHNGITFNEMVQGPCFKGLGWEKLRKN